MCDHHLELGLQESQQATAITSWDKWVDAVEAALGHSLDGCQWVDGYSLDDARESFNGDGQNEYTRFTVDEYIARVRRDKASVAAGKWIHTLSSKSFEADSGDGETSRWDEVTLYVGSATDASIDAHVEACYPSEHCQHEYDCCAHWYAHRASWKRVAGNLVVVKQSFYQNI